jgi:hypothetical protein
VGEHLNWPAPCISNDSPTDFTERQPVQTLDEMRSLHLLTPDQHAQIGAWIAERKTPEAILQMPPHLWRAFAMASMLMGFDADVVQPPLMEF